MTPAAPRRRPQRNLALWVTTLLISCPLFAVAATRLPTIPLLACATLCVLIRFLGLNRAGRRDHLAKRTICGVVLAWVAIPVSTLWRLPARLVLGDWIVSWPLVALALLIISNIQVRIGKSSPPSRLKSETTWVTLFLTCTTLIVLVGVGDVTAWMTPPSSSTCRLLAVEHETGFGAGVDVNGTIYAKSSTSLIAVPMETYEVRGPEPVYYGHYRLVWTTPQSATITLQDYQYRDTLELSPILCP